MSSNEFHIYGNEFLEVKLYNDGDTVALVQNRFMPETKQTISSVVQMYPQEWLQVVRTLHQANLLPVERPPVSSKPYLAKAEGVAKQPLNPGETRVNVYGIKYLVLTSDYHLSTIQREDKKKPQGEFTIKLINDEVIEPAENPYHPDAP